MQVILGIEDYRKCVAAVAVKGKLTCSWRPAVSIA